MHLFSARALSIACAVAGLAPAALAWPMWWPPWKGDRGYGDNGGYGGHGGPGGHGGHSGQGGHGGGGYGGDDGDCNGDSDDFQQRNFDTISRIYGLTVYPNQLPIIQHDTAGIPSGLFNQYVVGRVDPVGDFEGFEDSIEYFFALSPLPQANLVSAAITGYKITEFSSSCREVASSVVYLYCNVVKPGHPDDGKALVPLKQVCVPLYASISVSLSLSLTHIYIHTH